MQKDTSKRPGRMGHRSGFSLLPHSLRVRIIAMLDDGATYEAVAADPEVSAAFAQRGLRLTPQALSRVRKCAEYREVTRQRRQVQLDLNADRLTAALLKEAGAAESIADNTRVALLRLVRQCAEANPDDPREVERLARSVVSLDGEAHARQVAALKRRLEESRAALEACERTLGEREAAFQAALAERDARIARLEAALPGVDGGEVARAMKDKFGV